MEISLEGLNIYARHGVMEQERKVGNRFVVDISLSYPPALEAARTDTLGSTINYAELVAIIKETMETPSLLLENVALRIRQTVMSRWPGDERWKNHRAQTGCPYRWIRDRWWPIRHSFLVTVSLCFATARRPQLMLRPH